MKLSSILVGVAALLSHAVLAADAPAEDEGPSYVIKTVISARIEVRVDKYGYTVHNYLPIAVEAEPTDDSEAEPAGEAGPTAELIKRGCTRNNCLRALVARPAQASSFCATYTTAVSTGVGPFTQCDNSKTLSSACTCEIPVSLVHLAGHPRGRDPSC